VVTALDTWIFTETYRLVTDEAKLNDMQGVSPLVESILQQDLDRFAKFAKSNYLKSGKM
jgi:hypothetical protein